MHIFNHEIMVQHLFLLKFLNFREENRSTPEGKVNFTTLLSHFLGILEQQQEATRKKHLKMLNSTGQQWRIFISMKSVVKYSLMSIVWMSGCSVTVGVAIQGLPVLRNFWWQHNFFLITNHWSDWLKSCRAKYQNVARYLGLLGAVPRPRWGHRNIVFVMLLMLVGTQETDLTSAGLKAVFNLSLAVVSVANFIVVQQRQWAGHSYSHTF